MRTSHVLAAIALSAVAAASSPASAVPDGSTAIAVHDATRAQGRSVDADADRYAAREKKEARQLQKFQGGDEVVVIASSTAVLILAIVLIVILV